MGNQTMHMAEGNNIYLRCMEDADTELIVKWRNTDFVRKNFIYQQPFTIEGHQNWVETKVKTGQVVQFIICEKHTDREIGSVYFRDIDSDAGKAEYGIFIGEADALGKGYGSETAILAVDYAKKVLHLHKLFLRVFADNQAAIGSYRKAGFEQEAYLKEEVKIQGNYQDIILMAIIFKD